MDKLVRFRKAFYEKENDLHHNNKRKEPALKQDTLKLYQSLPHAPTSHPQPTTPPNSNITTAFCQQYGQELLEPNQYNVKPPSFLKNHEIDGLLRARMLDWMVEVTSSYKFTNKSYFDGVQLMDRYFENEPESLLPVKLHIIGVQCMLIASKMEEVYPLKIRIVYEKIAHKKLPLDQLVEMEARIMKVLDYKLNSWTFFDLITLKLSQYSAQENQSKRQILGQLFTKNSPLKTKREDREQLIKKIEEVCSYLGKIAIYDYEFYCETPTLLLAQTILSAAFEVLSIPMDGVVLAQSAIVVEMCKQKLWRIARQFRQRFQGLGNIFKFTSREVLQLVEQLLIY